MPNQTFVTLAVCFILASTAAIARQPAYSWIVVSTAVTGRTLRISLQDGTTEIIKLADGLNSFGEVQVGSDRRTVGWVSYELPFDGYDPTQFSGASDLAASLTIWRSGVVQHVFVNGVDGILTWKFLAGGRQVAFHKGPMHFDNDPLCELHDAITGRRLATWHPSANRRQPPWATNLTQ